MPAKPQYGVWPRCRGQGCRGARKSPVKLTAILGLSLALAMLGTHRMGEGQGAKPTDPLVGIVFVAAPIFDEKTDTGNGYLGSYHWRDGYLYARAATYHRQERTTGPMRLGKNLYLLTPARPDGQLRQLTFLRGNGAVYKPEPSYDGRKILFSMRRDGEDWFHLYELDLDSGALRQLTDGPFNDFAGVYLPDGRIVFVSDRTGFLEEYHEERTECLFVMNVDGTGIHQITFSPGTYFEPAVLRDGRIIYAFWDPFHINIPPLDKHETILVTVNPDGTEERHYFGAGQHQFFHRFRHGGISLTTPREMPDGRILVQTELGPALVDTRCGPQLRDALTPLFPGATSVQIGGTTHRVHLSPLGTRSTAYPLPDGRILYSATQPGARDSAIYIMEPKTREEKLVYNIPNSAEFDPVPVRWPRPVPRRLPQQMRQPEVYASGLALLEESASTTRQPPPGWARFVVVAGKESDFPERAAGMARARYLRVVEAEYTAVTTSSHTSLETRILGVVPIYEDGSAYFEVPADTPIFLDVLDAAGQRVMHAWPVVNTSIERGRPVSLTQIGHMVARSGEVRACYGCHAPQHTAVPNVVVEALRYPPVRIGRAVTNLQYRRNEPDAYRRQAIVGAGFGARYRSWLASRDTWVRARGCELLAFLEDEASNALPRIVELTRDTDVEVRRAATYALCVLAKSEHVPLLRKLAEDDADELVRFHARSVLQVFEAQGDEELEMEAVGRLSQLRERDWERVRNALGRGTPPLAALRAAGRLRDTQAVPLLVPWLDRPEMEPYAKEAARALGRIASAEAVTALWQALHRQVPKKQVFNQRYFQHGPRPEEWAVVEGLVLAQARPRLEDVHLLIALLPNAFMEKPRFEDRLRSETARVVWVRTLLERGGYRKPLVRLLCDILRHHEPARTPARPEARGKPPLDEPDVAALYQAVLCGVNLERPFDEHHRLFPVVEALGAEEALWLLTCLALPGEVPEEIVTPYLTSSYHRERIDAVVLLTLQGFRSPNADPQGAEHILLREASQPYAFSEIWSIGKGMPDDNFRDKAYMVQALAMHLADVAPLERFTDPHTAYRDLRYALARGLARRGKTDAIPLLLRLCRDPLTVVRQEARYALAEIRDQARLRGEVPPRFKIVWDSQASNDDTSTDAGDSQTILVAAGDGRFAERHDPPKSWTWSDTTPTPLPRRLSLTNPLSDWQTLLVPQHFRNLNIVFIRGAERMMVERAAELQDVAQALRQLPQDQVQAVWQRWLDSPYPYAQYLALEALARQPVKDLAPLLLKKLDEFARTGNAVGFWWCCEALASVAPALPVQAPKGILSRTTLLAELNQYIARPAPASLFFGPEGMALGYPAARAIGRIAASTQHELVRSLWQSENPWWRAAVLRGLGEANAPGLADWLEQGRKPAQPALVRHEAEVQMSRARQRR